MGAIKFTDAAKDEFLRLIREGTRRGEALEQIGISRWTLREHMKDEEFARAVEEAEVDSMELVENAMFKKAIGGNVTAGVFMLCNRWSEKYRSPNKIQLDASIEVTRDQLEKRLEYFLESAIRFVPEERRREFIEFIERESGMAIGHGESVIEALPSESGDVR